MNQQMKNSNIKAKNKIKNRLIPRLLKAIITGPIKSIISIIGSENNIQIAKKISRLFLKFSQCHFTSLIKKK
jgi:hypothetical protein